MGSPSQPAPAPRAQPTKARGSGLFASTLRPVPVPVPRAPEKRGVVKAAPRLAAVAPAQARDMTTEENSSPPVAGLEPTVLLVGRGERFAPALEAALSRHHVLVESSSLDSVVDAVVTVAPDLVLVVGDAARDAGNLVLDKLAVLPKNFVVPIVILSDETALDAKLRAFRQGATAIIPRTASVDATANKVAELAREIPGQSADTVGLLGEATLEEFVATLEKQLRSGLEGVGGELGPTADMRLVLGQGRPLAEFVDNFVRRVRRHVLRAEPLRYELGERAGSAADNLGLRSSITPPHSNELFKLRVILADDDTPRADAVAQELRSRGSSVVVTDLDPTDGRFQKLRQVDPTILIIGENHVHGAGHSLLRRMRRDARLRWASMMIVRWEDVFPENAGAPAIERFESTLAGLAEPERALRDRIELKVPFETRLEVMGPARCLRTLAGSGHPLRVTLENARVEVTVDLSDGLLVGAQGRSLDGSGATFDGVHALSALLVVGSGRICVEPADQPASANIMSPVDVAITMADAETPPISPSIPAAGTVSIPPFQAPEADVRLPSLKPVPVIAVTAAASDGRAVLATAAASRAPVPAHLMTPPGPFAVFPPPAALPRSSATRESYATSGATATETPPSPSALVAAPIPHSPRVPGNELASIGSTLRRHLDAARRWLQAEEARAHQRRIAPRTALLLLGLGVLQALGMVGVYASVRALSRNAGIATAPTVVTPVVQVPTPAAKPAATSASSSLAGAAPSAAPATATLKAPDGSGRKAPDCKTLFGSDPPPAGYYPGAAWQEVKGGRSAIVRGDLGAAQASFCRAVRWDNANAEIAMQLAQVLLLHRDGAQALEWARKAASIDPRSLRTKETLGDALARMGEEDEARAAWFAAAKIDPSDQRGVRGLVMREVRAADRALKGRELVVAEKYFRRAALLEPRSWAAMVGLSYVLLELGEVKPAVVWAERAVGVAPRNASVRLALGDALARSGDNARATAAFREATLLDPNNREAQKRLRRGD
jgi:tetratricopeptide (TPR) repeat protein/DNA-binding response OmpR family regulator